MRQYKRMTWDDRLRIEALYNAGHTYRFIADQTGFTPAAIHYEVKRGLYDHMDCVTYDFVRRYSAQIAHENAVYNASAKGQQIKLGKRYDYAHEVARRIHNGESPDSIVGTKRRSGEWTVSTPTLYRYILSGFIPNVTTKDLREQQTRRQRTYRRTLRTHAPKGKSIEKRPAEVCTRQTFGHWELDSIIGKSKGTKQSFLTLTERKTRFEIVIRVKDKTASSTVKALDRIIPQFPHGTFKTITVDNGGEFQDCYGMEHDPKGNKRLDVYYCHPYTSCERGTNERNNRMLRRYFPKGQSFQEYTQKDCDKAAHTLNNIPRKILNYATAQELFTQELENLSK